jgi:glycopeptide antibiotics resistance protein
MLDNFIVFIPLGLLLGANLRQLSFGWKLMLIFGFSASVEMLQYVFAIGRTDITDVIMNTIGGLLGLALYSLFGKFVDNKKLDQSISVVLMAVLMLLLSLRFFVFKVRY